MQIRHACLLLGFLATPAFSQWRSAGNVDATSTSGNTEATLQAGASVLSISVLADDLIRVRFQSEPQEAPDRSWAVVRTDWPVPAVHMKDSPSSLVITTAEMTLVVEKKPLRLTFRDKTGGVIAADNASQGMSWNGAEVCVWKTMPPDERYYGFGEKAGNFQKRDAGMTMWNSDIPAYTAATDPLYHSIPFFYGIRAGKAYGIFFDNTARSFFDMGKESRESYSFGAEGGDLNYYFFYGPAPKKILTRFTELVGRMPLPPRWSLGYQQCRWSYAPESRVRTIAREFRSRNIPCDVIYLDIDYMDGYRIFTWNPKSFPNPSRLISDLASDGFKIAVIVDPGIKVDSSYAVYRSGLEGHSFVRNADGTVYRGAVWPGICAFPDFTSGAARTWWGSQFAGLVAAGVRGFWNDMNEPSVFNVPSKTIDLTAIHDDGGLGTTHAKNHNIYGMEMVRATYEGVRRLLPNERPFILTRASYAGGARYSAAWTGDNVASWEHLAMTVPMCLNMSISGQPFVGSDIGGFIGHPSGELFARWLQLGVFTPLMRGHSVINEKNKEPWEYGTVYTDINRETINLRYRLLPYIYTSMAEASTSGIPAMRPLVFEFPEESRFAETADEFMFGSDLLVAPVLTEGDLRRSVDLPKGTWYDFWSGVPMEGGSSVTVDAPVSRIPVFAREGSVIPTQQAVQYTAQAPIAPLTLFAFPPRPGSESVSPYYEDDGSSYDYTRGGYYRRSFRQSLNGQSRTLKIDAVEGSYVPSPRSLLVRFMGCRTAPSSVQMGARKLDRVEHLAGGEGKSAWIFDGPNRSVIVTFPDSRQAMQVLVQE
jgi:alpha-glucosidase